MKLNDLIENEPTRRAEFPVCADNIFLAHAAVSPLPGRVAAAMRDYLDRATRGNQEDFIFDRLVPQTRELTARLVGVTADEVAFTGSTSMGLAMVAAGLAWQPGDNVVCYREDYPANVYPWMDLAARGVEARFVEPRQYGNVTVADLERVVDERTRLVSLASAHFVSGWRLDVAGIGRFLRARGVLFCLDGIQTIGALRTPCEFVDFASADAHKWLLGPLGTAILVVRKERFAEFHPPLVGWSSAPCPGFIAQSELKFWPSARRYEPGSLNIVGLVGLCAALEMIHEMGIEAIEARVLDLAGQVRAGVERRGYTVLGPRERADMTGAVSFRHPTRDLAALQRELAEQGIVVSLRQTREGEKLLRVSAHFYNTAAEIERVLDRL